MNRPLRVLLLEDLDTDAELALRALTRDGFQITVCRATSAAEFAAALREPELDVILADYSLPDYDGRSALELVKKERPEVPFIFVSGSMGEETAIDALHHGATDYVLKQRLARLGPAVRRAMAEVAEHRKRQQAEQALKESERRFRDMLENVGLIAMTLDTDGRLTFCNDFLLQLTGWKREEVIGADWFEKFIPEGRSAVKEMFFSTVKAGTMPRHYENPIRTRTGELRAIVWNNTMLYDAAGAIIGAASIGEDVTERMKAADALRESEEKFRQFAETIDQVFWMTNPDATRMLYVSPAYERMWGRSCESLYQHPTSWFESVHPKDRDRIREALAVRLAEGTYDEEYRIQHADGSVHWIHDRGFPIRNGQGEVVRVAGIAADITRRKDLEEQFRQSQKMEAVGQLAGGVAHDFNNLLQAILGYSEIVLKQTPSGDPRHEDLLEIQKTGQRAADLTHQLLALARKQNLDQRITDLNALIEDLSKILRRVIGEDIRIDFDFAPQLDRVSADTGQIGQILLNLAVNARDAMPRGGRLAFQTSVKTLSERDLAANAGIRPGRFVCVSVTDTGTGMAPDIMEKLFQPFFTTKAPGKGTGLGLATSYGIARQHGGWMDVSSEPGKGTTFKLYLPAIERAVEPLQIEPEKTAPSADMLRGAGQRILFVEDEDVIRTMVQRQLQRNGYSVISVADATAAVDQFVRNECNFDLVLTDVVLPDINGIELLEDLLTRKPGLRVLISSGYTDNEKRWPVILERKWPFIGKPYSSTELLTALHNIFSAG